MAFALVLSAFAWWPMFAAHPNTQGGDGIFFHQMFEATRISIVRYRELPLWNPFQCGGVPLWDNPQSIAAGPLALVSIWTGTTRALELWYVLHSALGFVAMWILARGELSLSRGASIVASASWAFCGSNNQHLAGGHTVWAAFLYFPLAIALWRRAETNARMAIGLGLTVALMIHEGAIYAISYLAVLLAAETLTRAWPPKRLLLIARAGAVVVAVAFTTGASRFLPVLDQLKTHKRAITPDADAMQWETLKDVFLARSHDRVVAGQQYVWPEFGDYLGPFLLGLAVLGVILAGRRLSWLVALLAFSFALMLGHVGKYAPWSILNGHLYPFTQMRVPSRFVIEASLFISIFAGVAIDRVGEIARRLAPIRWAESARIAVLALGLIGVGDMLGVGIQWCALCFTSAPQLAVAPSTRLYLGGPGLAGFIEEPAQNRGRFECWEEWGFMAGAPLWEGDVPQARASDDGAIVEVANRTQNTFTLEVTTTKDSRVLVNSAYDRGWRTDVGTLTEQNKQLALDLPPGRHKIHLVYWPHGLTGGFILVAIGVIGIAAFFAWDELRRSRAAGLTAVRTQRTPIG